MTYLKDALSSLFDSKQKQVIALLLIVIGGFSVNLLISNSEEKVEEELEVFEEEQHLDEIEAVKVMKDVEANSEQIKLLWIKYKHIEDSHKEHIQKRKH